MLQFLRDRFYKTKGHGCTVKKKLEFQIPISTYRAEKTHFLKLVLKKYAEQRKKNFINSVHIR